MRNSGYNTSVQRFTTYVHIRTITRANLIITYIVKFISYLAYLNITFGEIFMCICILLVYEFDVPYCDNLHAKVRQ